MPGVFLEITTATRGTVLDVETFGKLLRLSHVLFEGWWEICWPVLNTIGELRASCVIFISNLAVDFRFLFLWFSPTHH